MTFICSTYFNKMHPLFPMTLRNVFEISSAFKSVLFNFCITLIIAIEKERSMVATRGTTGSGTPQGITLAAAKYSSEDAATLVNYTIAIVEYTQLCGPLKNALEKVQELQREIEENERLQMEKENEVRSLYPLFLFENSSVQHVLK